MSHLKVPKHDFDTYQVMSPIASMTLVSNWTESTTAALRSATRRVVEANPLLSARLEKVGEGEIEAVPGAFADFVVEIDGPPDFEVPTTTADAVRAMQATLEPLFAPHSIGGYGMGTGPQGDNSTDSGQF